MRRLDAYEKRKRRTNIIVTVIVAFLMVASIFAIVLDRQTQDSTDYNSHSFVITDTGYKTKINGKYMDFYYFPGDVERIGIEPGIMTKVKNAQAIAFIFDPNDNVTDDLLYIDTMRYDLQTQLDKPVYFGIINSSSKYTTLPVINCANATAYLPLILINISVNTEFNISKEYPNCIIMNGKLKDILALKDRFVYTYYGIMS